MRGSSSVDDDVFLLPVQRRCPPMSALSTTNSDCDLLAAGSPEIVLLVAPPACGKSTLTRKLEAHGYRSVNQDSLGNVDKCLDIAKGYLRDGECVCVDNTNMDPVTRAKWVALAGRCGALVSCLMTANVCYRCWSMTAHHFFVSHRRYGVLCWRHPRTYADCWPHTAC